MSSKFKFAAAALASISLGLAAAGSAAAADYSVLVVNNTNHTLTNLYASSINDPNYHGDWLGRYVLHPGQSITINFNDGAGSCLFDVRGNFNDSTYVQQHGVNVCSDARITFNGD
jgi:hypothetical protein